MKKILLLLARITCLGLVLVSLQTQAESLTGITCSGALDVAKHVRFSPREKLYSSSNATLIILDRALSGSISSMKESEGVVRDTCDIKMRRIFTKRLSEAKQNRETIRETLSFRSGGDYRIPVFDGAINTSATALPNAPRPYRANVTDGVHHGIDFYGKYGATVISASDAVVIRVVDGFTSAWFDRILRGKNLTPLEKAKNLDIYRGNQVWTLAPDGSVSVYSHLSTIAPLSLGQVVRQGEAIGKIGTSGIPDGGNYRNYHLHFELYPLTQYGTIPDPESVMLADWKWRDIPRSEMTESIRKFFGI